MTGMVCLRSEFEHHPITTLTYKDQPAWIAREIGSAIGYSHGGKRFANKVTGDWSDEFLLGIDYIVVEGDDLAAFKAADELGTESVPSRTRSLVLLFESGLHLGLIKTRKPVGQRLRRFLVEQVMPQLARAGRYRPELQLAEDGALAARCAALAGRELRVLRPLPRDDRRLQVATLQRTITTLHELGTIGDELRSTFEVVAAEIATGRNLAMLKPATEDDWQSPSEIASRLGVTANRVGRTITALELRGNKPGLARAVLNKAKGHDKTVTSYIYSPVAVVLIEARLRSDGYLPDEQA